MASKKEQSASLDVETTKRKLRFKFPDSKIVFNPELQPTEAVCEVEPTADHPEYSVAVAVIKESAPHHHETATETYEVLSGILELHLGKKAMTLVGGHSQVIEPGTVHWAKSSNNAWVRVTSRPGWTPQDHILDEAEKVKDGPTE